MKISKRPPVTAPVKPPPTKKAALPELSANDTTFSVGRLSNYRFRFSAYVSKDSELSLKLDGKTIKVPLTAGDKAPDVFAKLTKALPAGTTLKLEHIGNSFPPDFDVSFANENIPAAPDRAAATTAVKNAYEAQQKKGTLKPAASPSGAQDYDSLDLGNGAQGFLIDGHAYAKINASGPYPQANWYDLGAVKP